MDGSKIMYKVLLIFFMIGKSWQSVSGSMMKRLDKKTMDFLTHYCTHGKLDNVREEDLEQLRIFDWLLIYPGTNWCGAGNISESYDDLGDEVEADRCCRDHDYCPDNIKRFSSKHGLRNNSPFTKSHCNCDDIFYECLRKANTGASNRVGRIYFNYIRMECFKEEYPIKRCRTSKGIFRPRCIEYELNKKLKPIWEFFDATEYKSINSKRSLKVESGDVSEYNLSSVLRNSGTSEGTRKRICRYLENLAMNEMVSNSK